MRPDAEVEPFALAVDADLRIARQSPDVFGFVLFATILEEADRRVALPDFPHDRLVATDDLVHAPLDFFQIVQGERLGAGEIVEEAGLGRRSEGDLGVPIKLLDRLGHDMGAVVAQQRHRLVMATGDDCDARIAIDFGGEVLEVRADHDGQGVLGQSGADCGGDFEAGDRSIELAHASVGQRDSNHMVVLSNLSQKRLSNSNLKGFRFLSRTGGGIGT